MLLAWVVGAVLWRAPSLFYTDLNWDESLYRLVGGALLHGHAPYGEIWDRKPPGLFVLVAAVQAVLGPSAAALHVAGAVAVGLGGWLLAAIARRLLPRLPVAGPVAGVLWLALVGRDGGAGVNAELFFVPLNLAGLWLLLRARDGRALLAAGLLFGAAVQVKYNAGIIVPAFLLAWRLYGAPTARPLRAMAQVGAGMLLPTAMVLGWYAMAGGLGAWFTANVLAHQGLVAPGPWGMVRDLPGLPYLLGHYDVAVAGAVVGAGWLALDRARGLAAVLAAWLAADIVALLVLNRIADHMLIQLLPVLCVAAGLGAARTLAAAGRHAPAVAAAGVVAWIGWSGRDMARPFAAAAEVAARRQSADGPDWGDPSATAGHGLARRLAPGETVYVFGGPILGIYAAAGRMPPTRFPFAEHLWSGYAPVDGVAELRRVMATRPAFIAVEARWLKGGEVPDGAAPVFAVLHAALAADYLPDSVVPPFVSRGGGPIGPRTTIALFRRAGLPDGEPAKLTRLTIQPAPR